MQRSPTKSQQGFPWAIDDLLCKATAFYFFKVEFKVFAAWPILWTGQSVLVCQAPWKRCTCSPLVFEKTWVGYLPCGRAPAPPHSAACCSLLVPGLAVASHHGVVVAVHTSQDGVVEGGCWAVRAFCGAVGALTALAAEDLLERRAHFLVSVRVDDRVHGRVELSEEQEEFFIGQDIALGTANIEEQQD